MNGAINLCRAPYEGVYVALAGFFVQVFAIGGKRVIRGSGVFALALAFTCGFPVLIIGICALRHFADAMRDEINRVIARHALLLQEVGGVAVALGK